MPSRDISEIINNYRWHGYKPTMKELDLVTRSLKAELEEFMEMQANQPPPNNG